MSQSQEFFDALESQEEVEIEEISKALIKSRKSREKLKNQPEITKVLNEIIETLEDELYSKVRPEPEIFHEDVKIVKKTRKNQAEKLDLNYETSIKIVPKNNKI